ncbi:hypothetical protein JM658_15040 [Joostella atrarenae]|uniref:Sugar transporter n=1 Tax=Joostella atrarenae TaxID=679257 RepID=A0ABS9J6X5_9FLAO|nr:hypothetical protein [Joostella atrarenae]MCF8716145.1 hypothetical protein [Joostella atrarenae]
MDDQFSTKIPWWFWLVTIVALLWNLMGVGAFIADMTITDEAIQALPKAQQDLYLNNPIWVKAAYGIAVIGGALGCILLIFRVKTAKLVFIISFIAILIQMGYNFLIASSLEVYGPGAYLMPIMIIVIAAYLIIFSGKSIKKGWLK